MADFCTDFETGLKSYSAITALVGSGTAALIFPDDAKQGTTTRHLVYEEVGGESVGHLRGRARLCHAVVGVYAYGTTRAEANELAETVKDALCPATYSFKGTWGTTYINGITCSDHRSTGKDRPQDGSDSRLYWCYRVYDIWHSES